MSPQKPGLHPRNRHHSRYDLATLCKGTPELAQYLVLTLRASKALILPIRWR